MEPEWLGEHVSVLAEDRVQVDPALWAQAAGFLERRETFRADYQTFAGKVSAYELGPLHLLAYHGNWYLLALNAAKGRVESFALSRFRRIEGLGRTFDRTQDFDARAHARQAFGIAGGEKPMKIRLLFEPKLAVYISERQWHPSQTLKKRPDGRVELRMETTGRKELVRWVLSWMPDVRVLTPKSLRDRITLKLAGRQRRSCVPAGLRLPQPRPTGAFVNKPYPFSNSYLISLLLKLDAHNSALGSALQQPGVHPQAWLQAALPIVVILRRFLSPHNRGCGGALKRRPDPRVQNFGS